MLGFPRTCVCAMSQCRKMARWSNTPGYKPRRLLVAKVCFFFPEKYRQINSLVLFLCYKPQLPHFSTFHTIAALL